MIQRYSQLTPVEGSAGQSALGGRPSARRLVDRVAIVGERNSGKTSLVNTLLGARILPASFVTQTNLPTVIEFGAKQQLSLERPDRSRVPTSWEAAEDLDARGQRLRLRLPLPALQHVRLVDTPGLGDGDEFSDRRTRSVCRNAHVLVWCTSALQAWKASERNLWLLLCAHSRATRILVVTFTDMLRCDDASRVKERLQAEAAPYFDKIIVPSQLTNLLVQNDDEVVARMDSSSHAASSAEIHHPAEVASTLVTA